MKKVKVSLMLAALLMTAGVTFATNNLNSAADLDCSPTGQLPATLDSVADCPGDPDEICCYTIDGQREVRKEFNAVR